MISSKGHYRAWPLNLTHVFNRVLIQFAHNFYIAQWLRDISHEFQQLQQREEKGDAAEQLDAHSRALQVCQAKKEKLMEMASSAAMTTQTLADHYGDEIEQKKLLKISEMQKKCVFINICCFFDN